MIVLNSGYNAPRMTSVTGYPLPSARAVSNIVHSSGKQLPLDSDKLSVMFMSWGQFISHDFIGTPMTKGKLFFEIMTPHFSQIKLTLYR